MKILIATGGTAGHINPALAVASYIREKYPKTEFLFVGTKDHMESRLVPDAGFLFESIEISGFYRKISFSALKKNIKTCFNIIKATSESKRILKDFDPDVVVGFGGYVSGPVLKKAAKMHYKTCIHEQNAYPGITNKALAKVVDKVMVNAEDAKKHLEAKNEIAVTGLPVRGEILSANREASRKALGLTDDRPLVLSTGGSLGAKPINKAMVDVIAKHAKDKSCYHIHSTGKNGTYMLDDLELADVDVDKTENITVESYIDNMDECYAAADLVIGRAGASSLSELEAMGKPSILIPSPYVAENHQFHNAMALVDRNAARIIEEKDLTGEKLTALVDEMLSNKAELKVIGENAKKMAILNSREQIADIILSLGKTK